MDKNTILQQTNQIEIYNFYYGSHFQPYTKISSPFSEDQNPSFKVFKNGTFKCFSTGKQGDVWQFVADIKGLDCKTQFAEVLKTISNDMGVILQQQQKNSSHQSISKNTDNHHFKYYDKPYTSQSLEFWTQGNWKVTKAILEKYNVKNLDKYEYFNSKKNTIQKIKLYSGIVGFIYKVNSNAEIYIPAQGKNKKIFYNNLQFSDIFGYEQLKEKEDYIIITAGKKDCLILNANGFPAVSFRSESGFIKEEEILKLKQKTDNIYICYDNDKTGLETALKLCNSYSIKQIILPEKYNDIADYFLVYDKSHYQKLIDEIRELEEAETKKDTQNTIFHITEEYLSTYYKFRYNTIALDIEYCKKTTHEWKSLNENSLYLELQKKGIKISINNLIAILKSEFVPHYNPIQEYFENLPKWDGKTDYISNLANYVYPLDREKFNHHFKKWAVRTVKCALLERYFNKQAFVLVHKAQNSGKSSFCRFLCPPELSQYLAEDISNDKDARILLCKNFLINLDELSSLAKKKINTLKSYFSKDQINERLPYDRKNSILPRICSFIGSTNRDTFLDDETGSVRWLCFQITGINWNYRQECNIDLFWSQAYALAFDNNFNSEMTLEEIQDNEDRNKKYQILSTEQELIASNYKPAQENEGVFVTSTDVLIRLSELGVRLSSVQIGKAFNALGFERKKHKTKQTYGYWVKVL
ncbi:toprim domain-containing protein [Riemerella anatipestifer]|uniref:VapE domain-containing protein n=1 Tax=Riemerella anatipestifer TaxID=34085 RepID=UPI00129D7967|nr:VapE domain-containing protein [Riemerella anatipestifer]MRM85866.1 toprim domain-containing protein [Riemerella anatipestifer]MRM94755.1 toprim domain-containing protein [Riemerella anatipestifer]